jgi:deazaflavin-dependent oxidoreductase (nitroreductase family)
MTDEDAAAPTLPPRPKGLDSPLLPKVFRRVGQAQVWAYRRTNGRIGGRWRVGAGFRKPVPTLLLEHVGRTSGRRFTVPLLYLERGDDVVVVASQGGLPNHPQWYRNLCADPDVTIQVRADRRPVRARTATGEERAELWPRLLDLYADFATYQSWTEREIPVVVLEPR